MLWIAVWIHLFFILVITFDCLAFIHNRIPRMRRYFIPKEAAESLAKRPRPNDRTSNIEIVEEASTDPGSKPEESQVKPSISSFFAPRTTSATSSSSPSSNANTTSSFHIRSDEPSLLSTIPPYETILMKEDIELAKLHSSSSNDSNDNAETITSQWLQHDGLLFSFRTTSSTRFTKVVVFDLDHTIIIPRSKHRFPVDSDDWQFLNANVAPTLTTLAATGHGLLFLSNQQGLGTKPTRSIEDFTDKVDKIMKFLGLSIDVFCALEDNRFRKPLTGMWEFYQMTRGTPDMQVCFVGDAAGRPVYGTKPKDFSDSDIKMARNLQIPFYTPEKFFLKSTQRIHTDFPFRLPTTRLIDYLTSNHHNNSSSESSTTTGQPKRRTWPIISDDISNNTTYNNGDGANEHTNDSNAINTYSDNISLQRPIPASWMGQQELLVLAAAPASGKSTVALNLQANHHYVRVNRDELGSINTCVKLAKEALSAGKSVVVDNTNINRATRNIWVKLVRDFNANNANNTDNNSKEIVKIRALVLDVPKDICFQLAKYRIANPATRVADRRHIPSMAMHSFFKNKEDVDQVKEGFDRVDVVPFQAQMPEHPAGQRLFHMYLS